MCVSDNVVIIGRGMLKEKRIKLKTELCLCSVNPSPYSALIPAQYAPISTVMCVARDNGAIPVSLLRNSMMRDRYTLCIIAYLSNTLICL